MRGFRTVGCGVILSVTLWCASSAPAAAQRVDCQQLGGEVSALIDKSSTAKNLPAARSAFQVGIMECMEGDDDAANKHYQDVRKLLTGEGAPPVAVVQTPSSLKAEASPVADCQKLGSEVSALIDKSATSRNLPAARAAFQVGIMECMEGDDTSATKHYQDAKKALSSD